MVTLEDNFVLVTFLRLKQEIRERSRREEAAELSKGLVKWEVEVSLLQINLCSERAAGSFLLAAQKAQLGGRVLTMSNRNVLSVEMQASSCCSHPLLNRHLHATVSLICKSLLTSNRC